MLHYGSTYVLWESPQLYRGLAKLQIVRANCLPDIGGWGKVINLYPYGNVNAIYRLVGKQMWPYVSLISTKLDDIFATGPHLFRPA